jgi:hypothetical protein
MSTNRKNKNTIDGNIFNKHNDQEKKDISKKDTEKFELNKFHASKKILFTNVFFFLIIMLVKYVSIDGIFIFPVC